VILFEDQLKGFNYNKGSSCIWI